MPRHILHINIVNFCTAVAAAQEPRLADRPLAVVTTGSMRRAVLDVSPAAFANGVRRGMLLEQARRACRDLAVLAPTPRLYERAYNALLAEAGNYSPRVEPAGPGHVFVDLSGTQRLLGDPVDSSLRLRKVLRENLRLDAAVGVAANKLVSKVATRVIKPTGMCQVIGGCEQDFLAPLPVTVLPGIDHQVIVSIMQFNINIIKELVKLSERRLHEVFGSGGSDIYHLARGEDDTPVRKVAEAAPAVRESMVFAEQTNDVDTIERSLFDLVSAAGPRVRKMGLAAGKVMVALRYSDASRCSQAQRLRPPLSGDVGLFNKVQGLFAAMHDRRVRVGDMVVELSDLTFPYGQMDLFNDTPKEENLMTAMDRIRDSFGKEAIAFGRCQK